MSDPLFDLTGKTALVSGASRGIGASIAQLLAQRGAHVIVTSRRPEACETVAEDIRAQGGSAQAHAMHVGEPASIDALFAGLDAAGQRVDLLVNNAAANPDPRWTWRWMPTRRQSRSTCAVTSGPPCRPHGG